MSHAYAVIPLGILSLYLYLFSSFLVRAGVYSRKNHRKAWNYILLITFFVSALSGLFIALQINNKWEFSWIDRFLKWHVDFGIALSFTGIIHFLWHWPYYFGKRERRPSKPSDLARENTRPISPLYLFLLGFIMLTTQVDFIRAGLNLFDGNEGVTGLILSLWMLFTGLGAVAGKRGHRLSRLPHFEAGSVLVMGLLPLVMLTAIYLVKSLFFPYGTTPDPANTALITLLVLMPFCFFAGLCFTLYAFRLQERASDFAGRAYVLESAGSMAAGIFTGFISIFLFSLLQTTLILVLLSIALILFTLHLKKIIENTLPCGRGDGHYRVFPSSRRPSVRDDLPRSKNSHHPTDALTVRSSSPKPPGRLTFLRTISCSIQVRMSSMQRKPCIFRWSRRAGPTPSFSFPADIKGCSANC